MPALGPRWLLHALTWSSVPPGTLRGDVEGEGRAGGAHGGRLTRGTRGWRQRRRTGGGGGWTSLNGGHWFTRHTLLTLTAAAVARLWLWTGRW